MRHLVVSPSRAAHTYRAVLTPLPADSDDMDADLREQTASAIGQRGWGEDDEREWRGEETQTMLQHEGAWHAVSLALTGLAKDALGRIGDRSDVSAATLFGDRHRAGDQRMESQKRGTKPPEHRPRHSDTAEHRPG